MKHVLAIVALVVACLFVTTSSVAYADGCYSCGSGSKTDCKQCRYGAKDTGDARKSCEKIGCKISGTSSCSTAANVKVCGGAKLMERPFTGLLQLVRCHFDL